ncbi:unnamed protein product [Urochloa humidicola]
MVGVRGSPEDLEIFSSQKVLHCAPFPVLHIASDSAASLPLHDSGPLGCHRQGQQDLMPRKHVGYFFQWVGMRDYLQALD